MLIRFPGKSVADGMDSWAGLGDHVRCHANLGQGDTDQAIASDDFGQLVFGPAFGPFRADGHHHEPMLLVGILHPDLDLFWQVEAELREHLARPAHDATAEVRRAVSLRRIAQNGARIAGAQRADDHVVQGGRVFKHVKGCEVARCPETCGLEPVNTDFFAGCERIGMD